MLKAKSFLMCVALFAAICGTVSGQRNETLFQAQKKLTELGYSPGSPDGLSGARTEIAIKKFQVDNKLSPTGTLDRVTLQKLLGSIGGTLSTKTVPPAKDLDRVFVDGTSTLMQRKIEPEISACDAAIHGLQWGCWRWEGYLGIYVGAPHGSGGAFSHCAVSIAQHELESVGSLYLW